MKSYQQLIFLAKKKMKQSKDPLHDLSHVTRVASYAKKIAASYDLSKRDYSALLLAVWWHDVGRTITSRSSFVFMTVFDDIISAFMLLYFSAKKKQIDKTILTAVIVLLSKSLFLNWFVKFISLNKERTNILHILQDADKLDMLHIQRSVEIVKLLNASPVYAYGYKIAINWFLTKKTFEMKTKEAKELLAELMQRFISWINEPEIMAWHLQFFKEKWIKKHIKEAQIILNSLHLELSTR